MKIYAAAATWPLTFPCVFVSFTGSDEDDSDEEDFEDDDDEWDD